jgi:hypothetical protein
MHLNLRSTAQIRKRKKVNNGENKREKGVTILVSFFSHQCPTSVSTISLATTSIPMIMPLLSASS